MYSKPIFITVPNGNEVKHINVFNIQYYKAGKMQNGIDFIAVGLHGTMLYATLTIEEFERKIAEALSGCGRGRRDYQ